MMTDYIYFSFLFFFNFNFFIKDSFLSFQNSKFNENNDNKYNFNPIRKDITDQNGIILSRSITAYHAAIRPDLIKDKKVLSKVKLALPEIDSKYLTANLNKKNIFI